MAVKIAPSPRQQFEDGNGLPYSGAKLFTYIAGSTTKQTTYTTSVGDVANSNPIVLDSAGRTPYGVWLTAGVSYKFVLAPSTDTDPPTSPIFTEDNITGVNDTSVSTSQWIASGLTPTYIGATQFSVVGDQTTELHVNRRLKLTVSAGTVYGKISVSAYTTVTTVTVVLDSGTLDSGLSAVEWSILSKTNDSMPRGLFAELAGARYMGLVSLAAGADIASAATIDLTAATGNSPRITGTTPTSAVTMNTGQTMRVVADGAWPLTFNATTNNLNTNGGDYTCTAGDVIVYHKDNSGIVHGSISRTAGVLSGNVMQVDQSTTATTRATTTTLGTTRVHTLSDTAATITAFSGVNGVMYHCRALGAGSITHHATNLIITQTGADITTAAGDTFDVYMLSATTCRLCNYQRANGKPLKGEDYIYVREEQASGTNGGTFTSGAWQKRTLNTEVNDAGGIASISSSVITLSAGTYRFTAKAPAYLVNTHKLRLANTTDSTYIYGMSAYAEATTVVSNMATVSGRFTIASAKNYELQHRCSQTKADTGFGVPSNFSVIEVYAEIELWKEV